MRSADRCGWWPILAGLLFLTALPVFSWAQEDSAAVLEEELAETQPEASSDIQTAPPGIVFNEIRLSETGVVATDVDGNDWRYDFGRDAWVEGTASTEGAGRPDRPVAGDDLPIEQRATQIREVSPGESSVTIGYDELVDGSILASGRVTVKGWVRGDVRSYKRVLVTETGQVDGDVEAPSVVVKPGGVVRGEVRETENPLDPSQYTEAISVDAIVAVTAIAVLMMFAGFLVVAVIPKQLAHVTACIAGYKTRSYAVGLLLIFLLPVIVALFVITIVGIVFTPILPILYLAAVAFGFIAFAGMLGSRVLRVFLRAETGLQLRTFAGMGLLALLWFLVIMLVGDSNSFIYGLGIALLVITIALTSFPICAGVGASFLTRFGRREYVSWRERRPPDLVPPAPAPPPLHTPPPVSAPGPVVPPPIPPAPPAPPPRFRHDGPEPPQHS